MILLIENYSTVELIDFPQKGGGVFIKLLTYLNIKEVIRFYQFHLFHY